ncbi:MAG: amidoligase family protein [Gammaproteobacteria bacterium]|jgi:hypothetical protein|nr:amidoligase family protein [Gammaproteobacteria bacterium]
MGITEPKFPPRQTRADGSARRVGVEIEFSGLSLEDAAWLLAQQAQLQQRAISDYEIVLEGDSAGDWRVERDQELLKQLGRERADSAEAAGFFKQAAEKALDLGSQAIVPLELVSPPLPFERLSDFQQLVDALAADGAVGTDDNVLFAFALQLNPELPDLEAATIRRYLQAFAGMQEWLAARTEVDAARKVTNYSALYPSDYIRLLLSEDYNPGQDDLINDYLQHNPTRNRALDMLPLFSYLDEDRVQAITADPKIKSRPTFHYRLPNSDIGKPDWTIYEAWNDWVTVEEIAESEADLSDLIVMRQQELANLFGELLSDPAVSVDQWLQDGR